MKEFTISAARLNMSKLARSYDKVVWNSKMNGFIGYVWKDFGGDEFRDYVYIKGETVKVYSVCIPGEQLHVIW